MPAIRTEVLIPMSDGVELGARIYRPEGPGPFPTLIAASPYRFDNDDIPPSMVFFWLETGPIEFYVEQGYAYVHVDIRGTGRSGGDYGFLDRRERRDLSEAIEWIAEQQWSSGRIGSIGMSYYCMAQWMMISERPPHLTCAAPYDGNYDPYAGWTYPGGVLSTFMWWWYDASVRIANRYPANGESPRTLEVDLPAQLLEHPELDDYWLERSFEDTFADVSIPVYSIGNWAKRELHLDGNLRGFQLLGGPKKLKLLDLPSGAEALRLFSTVDFHREVLLPFYDHYLKGLDTDYPSRPTVEYTLAGDACDHARTATATQWPPEDVHYRTLYFDDARSGTVSSVNDGTLTITAGKPQAVSYDYPQPHWLAGPVTLTAHGPDTTRETVTWTSPAFSTALDVVGPIEIVVWLSSTRQDTSVVARVYEQLPQDDADRAAGRQPASRIVSKGWLRAAHRAINTATSVEGAPRHDHSTAVPLTPDEPTELRVSLIGCGHRFAAGSRLRVELSCMDSKFTDDQFHHSFLANMVGTDTIHSGGAHPSRVLIPVRGERDLPLS